MRLQYRPEIDGLRTIAVISVLIYHAEFAFKAGHLLTGGFLGVDIFFVISGFLITSLIIKELVQTGRFSITDFYERRARRLLPALFTVMLVSLPFAWLYLIPLQFIDFAKSQLSSLLFASNFYWDHSLQEYGAESALLKPFLHTWSLAVEEQFYIIFPLILIGIYRWCKNHALYLLAFALLISLLFSQWMTQQNPSSSFYMLSSRFWELLAGSFLAYTLYKHPQQVNNTLLKQVMPLIGLLLIIYSVTFTKFSDNHPGLVTLPVIIGTVLIIWFANKKNPVTKLLSSKIFVATGLISYSLYLWHYPIFAFGRIINATPSAYEKSGWILLAFVLSLVSYFLIEKPFRNRSTFNRRSLLVFLGITAILIFGLNATVLHYKGIPSRLPAILGDMEMQPSKINVCNQDSCTFDNNSADTIFLVGDSHMMALQKPLLDYSSENKYNFTVLNTNGCQYVLNMNSVNTKTNKAGECNAALQSSRRSQLLSHSNALVILGGNILAILPENNLANQIDGFKGTGRTYLQYPDNSLLNLQAHRAAVTKEYRNTVLELANHGHKVILIYPVPDAGKDIPSHLAQLIFRKPDQQIKSILAENMSTTSYASYRNTTKHAFALLDSIQHKNIHRVYPHELFCDTAVAERCVTHDLEHAFYRDHHHLSSTGAKMLLKLLADKINKENIFEN
ncbi:MAG: acyltransferase [Gammaproteobacteria bacterium]|nr:acyltransferase [Gammaproteobacteria bacterium]